MQFRAISGQSDNYYNPGQNIRDICKYLTSSNGFLYKINNSSPFPPQINVA